MLHLLQTLDNRELAWSIWAVIIIALLLIWKTTRVSIKPILKILLSRHILKLVFANLAYVVTAIILLNTFSFWEQDLSKEAVIWLIFVGLPLTFKINKISKDPKSLLAYCKNSFKIYIAFDYLLNFYVLPFALEFSIVPVFLLVGAMQGYIEYYGKDEIRYESVKQFLNRFYNIVIFSILIFVIYNFVFNLPSLLKIFNLKELLLPIILTIGFIPLLYLHALYSQYQSLFLRIDRIGKYLNQKRIRKAKLKSIWLAKLSIHKVSKTLSLMDFEKLQSELSCIEFFNQELPSRLKLKNTTGLFRYTDEGFSEVINYDGTLSVNSVLDYFGYNNDEIHMKYCSDNPVFEMIGFKVFTFIPVFVVTPKSTQSLSYSYVNEFIKTLNWNSEYDPLVIDGILVSAIENKSFTISLLWGNLSLEEFIENGKSYSNKLDLMLVFNKGMLVEYYDKTGYNVWVKYLKSLNPKLIESYINEASIFNGNNDNSRIVNEINCQAESFAFTPNGFSDDHINEFMTEKGNVNFFNLLLSKYNKTTTIKEFKIINSGRYSILNNINNNTVIHCGKNKFVFDKKGNFLHALSPERAE